MFLRLCIALITVNCLSFASAHFDVAPMGQRYLDFIMHLDDASAVQKSQHLFASDVKKIINSCMICTNRDELMKQMLDVWHTSGGVAKVDLLELISNFDDTKEVVRFEISFEDGTIESVISILKKNDDGLLCEINEVFGEKCVYQW